MYYPPIQYFFFPFPFRFLRAITVGQSPTEKGYERKTQ